MPKWIKFSATLVILALVLSLLGTTFLVKPVEAAASLYEYYNSGDNANRLIYGDTWRAQTFTADPTHSVTSINLRLSRLGTPGTITVSIQPLESDDSLSGIDLSSGTTTGNDLTTPSAGSWRTIYFTVPYTLVSGAKYAIVVRAPSGNSSNTVRWRVNTDGVYDGGTMRQSTDGGSSWNKTDADCMFEVWGEPVVETTSEVWVDDDWISANPGDNVDGHIFGYDAFATIQDGINAVTGSTVHVAEGVYSPLMKIIINKDNLLLLGPQADVDPRPSLGSPRVPSSTGEAVVDGTAGNLGRVIEIRADNVVVNGLEAQTGWDDIICQDSVRTGTVVKYCVVHEGTGDDGIQLKYCTDGILEYNYVFNIAPPGDALSIAESSVRGKIQHNEVRNIATANAAIHTYGSDDIEITENLIDTVTHGNNKGGNGIRIGNKNGEDINRSGGLIKGNIIHNIAETGIEILTSHVLIEGNDIYNCTGGNGAIFANFAVSEISICENSIHDNTLSILNRANSAGIFIENTVDTLSVSVHFNNIYNNLPYGLTNEAAALLDATNNWWGANDGPDASPGSGDKVFGNVYYDPWLVIGISANPHNILKGGFTSTITADMTRNSNGEDASCQSYIPDGTEIIFTTNKGLIGSTQVTKLTVNGKAIATLTSSDSAETAWVCAKAPGYEVQATVCTTVNFYVPEATTSSTSEGDSVGGKVYPINKTNVLAPWLALAAAIIVGSIVLVRRRPRISK